VGSYFSFSFREEDDSDTNSRFSHFPSSPRFNFDRAFNNFSSSLSAEDVEGNDWISAITLLNPATSPDWED
jgi:hypothetical protein